MNEHLMDAVLHAALFFETSSESECDPDLAVKELEAISSSLQQMSDADQESFRRYARSTAARRPNQAEAQTIQDLVDGLLGEAD